MNEYERELLHLPDFLSIHLLFGRAEVQGSPCTSFSGIMFSCEFSEVLFQEEKLRSSVPAFFGVVSCVPSHCSENTTIAWHRGTGAPGVTFSARLWFQLRESPDDEAKENLLPEASIPKEV